MWFEWETFCVVGTIAGGLMAVTHFCVIPSSRKKWDPFSQLGFIWKRLKGNKARCSRGHELLLPEVECKELVTRLPDCGHQGIAIPCHQIEDFGDEIAWRCQEHVERARRGCGHFYLARCSEDGEEDECKELVRVKLSCGHEREVQCSLREKTTNFRCVVQGHHTFACGHEAGYICHEGIPKPWCSCEQGKQSKDADGARENRVVEQLQPCKHGVTPSQLPGSPKCSELCSEELPCGHQCLKPCHHPEEGEVHDCKKVCDRHCRKGIHRCPRAGYHPCITECPPCRASCGTMVKFDNCDHMSLMLTCHDLDLDPDGKPRCTYGCNSSLPCRHGSCQQPCHLHTVENGRRRCPPCGEDCKGCQGTLPCGHPCDSPCHLHEETLEPGSFIHPPCKMSIKTCSLGHTSIIGCGPGDVADDLCSEEVTLTFDLVCSRKKELRVLCKDKKKWEEECKSLDFHDDNCAEKCDTVFKRCGHPCPGQCKDCFKSFMHPKCDYMLEDQLKFCGHSYSGPCFGLKLPCQAKCRVVCEHTGDVDEGSTGRKLVEKKCEEKCGFPCKPCEEPCLSRCEHSECQLRCYEKCDREPCTKPCSKELGCGHPCAGFCGEICPKLCRECDKKEIYNLMKTKLGPDDRLISLPCEHTFTPEKLDAMFKTRNGNRPMTCETCEKVVHNFRRYGKECYGYKVKLLWQKVSTHGTETMIQASQCRALKYLSHQHKESSKYYKHFAQFKRLIQDQIADVNRDDGSILYKNLNIQEADSLQILAYHYRNLMIQLSSLEDQSVPRRRYSDSLAKRALRFVNTLEERPLPFTYQEIHDICQESQRCLDMYRLLLLKDPQRPFDSDVKKSFGEALRVLKNYAPYSDSRRDQFMEHFKEIAKILLPKEQYLDFGSLKLDEKLELSYYKLYSGHALSLPDKE